PGVADGADEPAPEVGDPADEVQDLPGQRVLEQGVESKVTPRGVFSRGAETYGARPPAVHVGVVGAERRHLEAHAPLDDEDNPELHAHGHGTAKETLDDGRRRGGWGVGGG